MSIIIIPGNPAVLRYYKAWQAEIDELNPDIRTNLIESEFIFDEKLSPEEYYKKIYSYYEDEFYKIYNLNHQPQIIIGHSVGGYFALRLLENHPDKIENVILLFPYLGNTSTVWTRIWSIYLKVNKNFSVINFVAKHKYYFDRLVYSLKYFTVERFKAYVRYGYKQMKYLLENPFDYSLLEKYKDKIISIHTKNDMWCPKKDVLILKGVLNSTEIKTKHAFVQYPRERVKINKEIAKRLQRD